MVNAYTNELIERLLAFDRPDAEVNDAAVSDMVRQVIGSGLPEKSLNSSLRDVLADDQHFDDAWQHNRIVLAESQGRIVSLSVISRPSRFAYSLDADTWIGLPGTVQTPEMFVEEYRIGGGAANSGGTVPVELIRSQRLGPQEVCRLFAGHAYRLTPVRQAVVLSFSLSPTSNTLTKIDCEERRTVEAQHIQHDVMALCSAAEILGQFGDERSFEELFCLLSHTSPHVRWAAATALVQISPERAFGAISPLEDDPDPQVRAAAHATIRRISAYLHALSEIAS